MDNVKDRDAFEAAISLQRAIIVPLTMAQAVLIVHACRKALDAGLPGDEDAALRVGCRAVLVAVERACD